MRQFLANSLFEIAVRARKSPWIETSSRQGRKDHSPSGLVRARGLKPSVSSCYKSHAVRARKSPWIETRCITPSSVRPEVRARKSPWIETRNTWRDLEVTYVRARKSPWIETNLTAARITTHFVRARKSPWIETNYRGGVCDVAPSGLVRARGLKQVSKMKKSP